MRDAALLTITERHISIWSFLRNIFYKGWCQSWHRCCDFICKICYRFCLVTISGLRTQNCDAGCTCLCHGNLSKPTPTLPSRCSFPGCAYSRLHVCLQYTPISISLQLFHLLLALLPGFRPQHPPDCSIYLYLLCWSLRQRVNWIYYKLSVGVYI